MLTLSSAAVAPTVDPDMLIVTMRTQYSLQSWEQLWRQPVEVPDGIEPPVAPPPVTEAPQRPVTPVVNHIRVGDLTIPGIVLEAYQRAADRLAVEAPTCRLRWQILAGIGKIESNHARGGRVTPAGDAAPPILGPVLNGFGPVAAISDHDGGRWDGDTVWDRAVGPMQFIPGTWAGFGADGSGDGVADPNNVFDATVAAGRYLCAGGADLATEPGLVGALLRYNHSVPYVAKVRAWIAAYDSGQAVPTEEVGPGEEATPSPSTSPTPLPSWSPTPSTSPTPSPTPPTPSPTPTPTPTETPSPSPTETPSPSPTPTPTPTDCPSPTPTETPSPSPTETPSPSPTPTDTPTPTPTSTPSPSPSPTTCPPAAPS